MSVREREGLYGGYGGRYVPETLIPALDELEAGWAEARSDPTFADELDRLGREYAGRPTPLTLAERFAPGIRTYLKREDLLHTGAHKLNNALGQAVLARSRPAVGQLVECRDQRLRDVPAAVDAERLRHRAASTQARTAS